MNKLRHSSKGITLIEILLVVVILGVLSAFAVPNFGPSYRHFQLQSTADHLTFIMRYAQSRAITRNLRVQLAFDPAELTYRILEEGPESSGQIEELQWNVIPGRWGKQFQMPGLISVEAPQDPVLFYPDGRIDKVKIPLCLNNSCLTLSTEHWRGHISVLKEGH